MQTSQNVDSRAIADGNYVSNQEDLDRWLEGVRPESSINGLQSTATLKSFKDAQKPLEILESQEVNETEPPQTVGKKIDPKIPTLTDLSGQIKESNSSAATVRNEEQKQETLLVGNVIESLAATSMNAGQQQAIILESQSRGDLTSREDNQFNIQEVGSIHQSQAINSQFSSQPELKKKVMNITKTSLDLDMPKQKPILNTSESACLNPNSSGNLNYSEEAQSQKQAAIENTVIDAQNAPKQSINEESVNENYSQDNNSSVRSIKQQAEPTESPQISEQEQYSEHQTEQDYTQVSASVDTQNKVHQNNALQNTGSTTQKKQEARRSKDRESSSQNDNARHAPEFDPEDFMALQGNTEAADTERWAQKIFSCVDVDGSGYIDKQEMRSMLEAFFIYITKDEQDPEEISREVDLAMSEMDANKDGMISFEEFLDYHLKMNGLANTFDRQDVKIESKDQIQDSQEQLKKKNQEITKDYTDVVQQAIMPAAKESDVSGKQVQVQKNAQEIGAPTMFTPRAEKIVIEIQTKEEQETTVEIQKHDLLISKQTFSVPKPAENSKLDCSTKIVKITTKSSNRLKYQFANVSKVNSAEKGKTIESPQYLSQIGREKKASLSNAASRKIKFLRNNLKHTAERLRSLQNKSIIYQKSEVGSIITSTCDKNSQVSTKIEKVALQSNKNRQFIDQLDKRPFSMENASRKKPTRQQDGAQRTEQLDKLLHNSNKNQTASVGDNRSFAQSPKIDSANKTSRSKYTGYELGYSGLTRAEIEALPVKELFKRINRNLRGMNRQTIQERCAERQYPRQQRQEISPTSAFEEIRNITSQQVGSILPSAEVRNWGFYQNQQQEDMILACSDVSYRNIGFQSNFRDRVNAAEGGYRNTQTAQPEGRGRRIKDILNYVKEHQKPYQNYLTKRANNNEIILNAPPKRRNDTISISDQDFNDAKLLEDFLKEQERRVDFGKTQMFQKIKTGHQSQIQPKNVLTSDQVEELFASLKNERRVTDEFDDEYLQQTQIKIMSTLCYLMSEIGLAQRFQQMQEEERSFQVTLERLRILTGRARKVYRASKDLSYIYQVLIQFQQEYPTLLNKITKIRGVLTEQGKESLQCEAVRLKNLVVQLVYSIRQLLHSYKFYNESFVFNDSDYLKHVANEMKEMKLQYSYLKVPFS